VRVAILAQYPVHLLNGARLTGPPSGHFATWLPQLHKAFKDFSKFDVHWIALSSLATEYQTITDANQTFHILPTTESKRASTLFARDRRRIREVLSKISPDLVHGWGTEDVYALAAVTSGFSNIVSMQGILSHYIFKTKVSPRDYLQALLEMFVFFKADRITVESAWGREIIRRRNPRANISLVEYGVDRTFFESTWSPDKERPVAIFVGSIDSRKGIEDAVRAFSNPQLRHAELWIVGTVAGEIAMRLRSYASKNVRWLGRLSTIETAKTLAKAWCLVLPTRADTSPNVVKEARVVGLPVVTTPCGGQSGYIRDGTNGYLVSPGDVANLTDKLVRLLGNFEICQSIGANLHAEDRAIFDPLRTATLFASIYEKAARPAHETTNR
jgi:glycosyltransferase involved in cell wall biosynthesis